MATITRVEGGRANRGRMTVGVGGDVECGFSSPYDAAHARKFAADVLHPVEAVPVFSQLRKESRRGRRKGSPAKKAPVAASGLEARMGQLEKSQAGLEKQMKKLVTALRLFGKGI